MMTIKETVNNEMGANGNSFIEIYDIDTQMLIYGGVASECPYNTDCIVEEYEVYNNGNEVNFVMWVDYIFSEVEESPFGDYMSSLL